MNYEKKYKEANDKVATRFGTNVAKEIFTDLYESEDEKVRRCIGICLLADANEQRFKDCGTTIKDCLAWLEKQGEKDKPTYNTYSKDVQLTQEEYDKKRVSDEATIKEVEAYKKGLEDAQKIFEKQGEQKPAWSEKDEKEYKYVLKFVDNILNNCGNKKDYEHSKRCYDWLKSLKQKIGE